MRQMYKLLYSTAGALVLAFLTALFINAASWYLPVFAGIERFEPNSGVPSWFSTVSMWLWALKVLAPGFVIGFLSPSRRLLLSALITYLLGFSFSTIENAYFLEKLPDLEVVIDMLLFSSHLLLLGAAGGALGLMRYREVKSLPLLSS